MMKRATFWIRVVGMIAMGLVGLTVSGCMFTRCMLEQGLVIRYIEEGPPLEILRTPDGTVVLPVEVKYNYGPERGRFYFNPFGGLTNYQKKRIRYLIISPPEVEGLIESARYPYVPGSRVRSPLPPGSILDVKISPPIYDNATIRLAPGKAFASDATPSMLDEWVGPDREAFDQEMPCTVDGREYRVRFTVQGGDTWIHFPRPWYSYPLLILIPPAFLLDTVTFPAQAYVYFHPIRNNDPTRRYYVPEGATIDEDFVESLAKRYFSEVCRKREYDVSDYEFTGASYHDPSQTGHANVRAINYSGKGGDAHGLHMDFHYEEGLMRVEGEWAYDWP